MSFIGSRINFGFQQNFTPKILDDEIRPDRGTEFTFDGGRIGGAGVPAFELDVSAHRITFTIDDDVRPGTFGKGALFYGFAIGYDTTVGPAIRSATVSDGSDIPGYDVEITKDRNYVVWDLKDVRYQPGDSLVIDVAFVGEKPSNGGGGGGDGGKPEDDTTLRGTDRADALTGDRSDETLFGHGGDDGLFGGGGDDSLIGGSGDDTLRGGEGTDTLVGGVGDDVLVADRGATTMTGGRGADTFVLQHSPQTAWIEDFSGNDRLDLSKVADSIDDVDFIKVGRDLTVSVTLGRHGAAWAVLEGLRGEALDESLFIFA